MKVINIKNITEINQMNNDNIHYVLPADKTIDLLEKISDISGLSIIKLGELIDVVNTKNETGCLYPKCKVSIYPKINDLENRFECLDPIIKDVITSNDLFKTKELLFISESSIWQDKNEISQILLDKLRGSAFLNVVYIL